MRAGSGAVPGIVGRGDELAAIASSAGDAAAGRAWVEGAAGSGKTAVTLAKMREATGRVLYVTHSAYLAQTARKLYSAHGYENPAQDVEFMSFREFVDSIAIPEGGKGGVKHMCHRASVNPSHGWRTC